MGIQLIQSEEQFNDIIKSPKLTVHHFYTEWSEQCQNMNQVLDTEAGRFKNVSFYKIGAEDLPNISLRYNITSVPTCILMHSGKEVGRVDGANTINLMETITQQLAKTAIEDTSQDSKSALNQRLEQLTHSASVMLFMKGDRHEPKCGFSKQIIDILNEMGTDYKTFDILQDEEVRQGLKLYTNWPTYPQLYVNGDFLGGLDIVREMKETGELQTVLPKKVKLEERLAGLIREHHCMVFMKGDRNTPKCGFSRQLMEILNETGVEYKTFDILQDEEVRQGLKTFSDWPTYPQVYVDGELIGGLDIIKELKAAGELTDTLKSKKSIVP